VKPFGYVQQGCRNKLQPFVVLTAGSVQEAQTISTIRRGNISERTRNSEVV
jgi:hypothetical protein